MHPSPCLEALTIREYTIDRIEILPTVRWEGLTGVNGHLFRAHGGPMMIVDGGIWKERRYTRFRAILTGARYTDAMQALAVLETPDGCECFAQLITLALRQRIPPTSPDSPSEE